MNGATVTLIAALVGAGTGVVALMWTVFAWVHEHATRVLVRIKTGAAVTPEYEGVIIAIEVHNKSRFPVRVNGVGLQQKARGYMPWVSPIGDTPLNSEVQPGDMAWFSEPVGKVREVLDLSQPTTARVDAAGKSFYSEPKSLSHLLSMAGESE